MPKLSQLVSDGEILQFLKDPSLRLKAFPIVRQWDNKRLERAWNYARKIEVPRGWDLDVLGRAVVNISTLPRGKGRVLVSIADEAFLPMQKRSFEMLFQFGRLRGETIALFAVDGAYEAAKEWDMVKDGRVHLIETRSVEKKGPALKGLAYSIGKWFDADVTACIEADVFPVGSIQMLFEQAEFYEPNKMWGVKPDQTHQGTESLGVLFDVTGPGRDCMDWLMGFPVTDPVVQAFNGGVLSGNHVAWNNLYNEIYKMGVRARAFVEGGTRAPFADEMVMNLALSFMEVGYLPTSYNVQYFSNNYAQFTKGINDPRLLHFLTQSRENLLPLLERVKSRSHLYLFGFSD